MSEMPDKDYCDACGNMENPDSWQSACIDDMCHGGEVPCMHGSYAILPCSFCGRPCHHSPSCATYREDYPGGDRRECDCWKSRIDE